MIPCIGIYVPIPRLSKFREKLDALGITTFNWSENKPVVIVLLTYRDTTQLSQNWYIHNTKEPDEDITFYRTEEDFLNQIILYNLGVVE